MTLTSEGTTGMELAESLLQGVGNEWMRAATRLLGKHRDGYWLRRFLDDQDPQPDHLLYIDRTDTRPSVNWGGISQRLMGELLLTDKVMIQGSASEMAMLRIAVSLAGATLPVSLRMVLDALDEREFRLVQAAMTEAVTGTEC
ncbi:hypothetical protein HET69_12965 [Streptomyces sp. CJ_13]|uniref:hypothetical protein n=1 Tax=Streptomyces sp. CJ_13 TaxID=2724943 RepID=UPI001BDC171A|nr:hypothetical protein [Streptomyces sp. CJ_13]MBT1184911.1 hypothetical protein [Streptomyces sp. CJ_13]